MAKKPREDVNQTATRIVAETIARHETPLPADAEKAWEQWSAGVGKVDSRTMALLKAAFEAGVKTGRRQPSI